MPYCENCGAEVSPNSKFCRNCGAAQPLSPSQTTANVPPSVVKPVPTVQPAPPAVQPAPSTNQTATNVPPPPPPQVAQSFETVPPPPVQSSMYVQAQAPSGERVLGVMVLRKPKSLGRSDSFTGVVTNQRMIFAQMTGEMLKQTGQMARDQAKAEGKGFLGQWSDQLKASFGYSQRYLTMQPSTALAETPGNFAVDNNAIREIKIKQDLSGRGVRDEFEMEIRSFSGKHEFKMDQRDEYIRLLKQVYGERVKMPFGSFTFHGVKIGF
jgi:hypothetical protein